MMAQSSDAWPGLESSEAGGCIGLTSPPQTPCVESTVVKSSETLLYCDRWGTFEKRRGAGIVRLTVWLP